MAKYAKNPGYLNLGAATLDALISVANAAEAQEPTGTLKKIQGTGAIIIGHREASSPFYYLDTNQQRTSL